MLKDLAPKATPNAVARARKLRRQMTIPEVLLWRELKGQPRGVKFRRQHPSSEAGFDFYCLDARLVIEVDGIAHQMGDNAERDERRDGFFKAAGLDTIRIPAADVLKDVRTVADAVVELAISRLPLHHPAAAGRSPSPRRARGGSRKES
jgi:very-short-patch-repair endonuclease